MVHLKHITNDTDTNDEVKKGKRADTTVEVDEVTHVTRRPSAGKHRAKPQPKPAPPRHGRHKADAPVTDPVNIDFLVHKPVKGQHIKPSSAKGPTIISAATGGILLAAISAATSSVASQSDENNSSEATASTKVLSNEEVSDTTLDKPIKASPKPKLKYDEPAVKTEAAPPPPVVIPPKPIAPPVVAAPAPAPIEVAAPRVITKAPVQTIKPNPVPVMASGTAAIINQAARAQVGVFQDCTMLVTNSLAAAGIAFHGWPHEYFTLGTQVPAAQAVPGDLIYYANGGMGVAHIAVYIGDGMAVHGGWEGNRTVYFKANVGSGPVFIRVS